VNGRAKLLGTCFMLALAGAVAFAVATPGGGSARRGALRRPNAAGMKTRCCFELSITSGLQLIASYPEHPDDPNFPFGDHNIHADWQAEQLVRYGELSNGTPLLIGILGGGARVNAKIYEAGLWNTVPPQEPGNGHRYVSTEGKQFDPNPKHGWLASRTFVTFVSSGQYIHVGPGPAIWSTFAKCGIGLSYHGRSAARSSWDGLNGPWQWVLKGPTRNQFRHATRFFDVVHRDLVPNNTHTGPGGVSHRVYGPAGDSVLVVFRYFPEARLPSEIERMKAKYPITSKGFRTLDDRCPA